MMSLLLLYHPVGSLVVLTTVHSLLGSLFITTTACRTTPPISCVIITVISRQDFRLLYVAWYEITVPSYSFYMISYTSPVTISQQRGLHMHVFIIHTRIMEFLCFLSDKSVLERNSDGSPGPPLRPQTAREPYVPGVICHSKQR